VGFVSYLENLTTTDNYTDSKRVIITHPNVTHQLLLTEFGDGVYNPDWENFTSTDGRSISGGLKLIGGSYPPPKRIQVSVTINELQLSLFDEIKIKQDYLKTPCTIQDKFKPITYIAGAMNAPTWLSGSPTTNAIGQSVGYAAFLVWVDTDSNYAQDLGSGMYRLQFTAKQSL
jgi:hypothetical protein